jgi:hypothetical protein
MIKVLTPRQTLNKAFLKVKPIRSEIEIFKSNLSALLEKIKQAQSESEEFHKNLISDFLKKTYYDPHYFINTKGRNDLVIHNGAQSTSSVGVIIEAKKPTNKTEMITKDNINKKAFQELVLYYLRERITGKNLEIRHLIATNINEWFVFDAALFDKLFAQNKKLVDQFNDFESKRLSGITTDFFYKNIVELYVTEVVADIEFAHFNLQDFNEAVVNIDQVDDFRLIALFKLFSPEHLLKLPFANDSNSLDKRFYGELLHIIGLEEIKEGSKKIIGRRKEGERYTGTLIEDTIIQLDMLDKLSRIDKPERFGSTTQERLFNIALELSIIWINRILFLKLLEAQLTIYHRGDNTYAFLKLEKIKDYDDLNSLFFQVLARRHNERNEDVKKAFELVPYLNSSLFEPTDIEHNTLFISNLRDDKKIPIFSQTVLKDQQGKKRIGNISTLEYLFEFLSAYDFSSEGSESIQEDNKTLINASVLGLIFEKINGYKEGSFFTPSFITMYMCRESIRKAVVQKFNEVKKWNCMTFDELDDKIDDRKEAHEIINSLKICDPAVGSGHFLVSALNEIIAIKSELRILQDRAGKSLKDYQIEVVNDELIVMDKDDGERFFEYNPKNKESQRVQEALFHEKQTIIEKCLFGVDINPNSVKICRLRLWIELLKNAYYKNELELETLPNIDINIKCGNSLVSRFPLDVDLKQAFKKSKWTIKSYRNAIATYQNAESKEQKREMERLIADIKSDFRSEISRNDPLVLKKRKLENELYELNNQQQLFEPSKKEITERNKKIKQLAEDIEKLALEIETIKSNKIFENAFEWRFEFPEVLDDKGDFIGFDVIIGNPPYIPGKDISLEMKGYIKEVYFILKGKFDLYISFIERGLSILKNEKNLCFIIPNAFLANENALPLREYLIKNNLLNIVTVLDRNVFDQAFVESIVLELDNLSYKKSFNVFDEKFSLIRKIFYSDILSSNSIVIQVEHFDQNSTIEKKIFAKSIKLKSVVDFCIGIQVGGEGSSKDFKNQYISNVPYDESYKKVIDGKDFDIYYVNWLNKYIKYGDWLHRKRNNKYFTNSKIMIRQIGDVPFATLDESGLYTLNTVYNGIILDQNYDIKYIFGLINSKLIKYIWRKNFSDGKSLFPKIKKTQLNEIPIAKADHSEQAKIVVLVDQIFLIKKLDKKSSVFNLESQINQLVYQLYNLTEDEIKIVEGAYPN